MTEGTIDRLAGATTFRPRQRFAKKIESRSDAFARSRSAFRHTAGRSVASNLSTSGSAGICSVRDGFGFSVAQELRGQTKPQRREESWGC
jgi:hypothetical protein